MDARTVTHVFDLSTHEHDKGVVRKGLDKFLPSRLVLGSRNAWGEFIPFDWKKTNEDILRDEEK